MDAQHFSCNCKKVCLLLKQGCDDYQLLADYLRASVEFLDQSEIAEFLSQSNIAEAIDILLKINEPQVVEATLITVCNIIDITSNYAEPD